MRTLKMFGLAVVAMVAVAGMPLKSASIEKFEKISVISVAHADEAAPAASPSPGVSVTVGDKIGSVGDQIGGLATKIPMDGSVIMVLTFIVGFIYDFVRRKWPTKNPASFWQDAKKILAGVKKVLAGLGALLDSIDKFGDKVLGQNVQS